MAFRDRLASKLISRGVIKPEWSQDPGSPSTGAVHLKIVSARRDRYDARRTAQNIAAAKLAYLQQHNIDCMVDDKLANCKAAWTHGILPYQVALSGRPHFYLPDTFFDGLRAKFPTRFTSKDECGTAYMPFPRNFDYVVTQMCVDRCTGRFNAKIHQAIALDAQARGYEPTDRVGFNVFEADS